MNKKNFFIACVFCSALLAAGSVYADDHSYLSGVGSKLGQGFANITTGVVEIPKNIANISHEQNIFVGMTWGLLRGAMETIGRTTVGVAELITPSSVITFFQPGLI